MITIDITLLIHIVNMIVLMVVLNKILYKPILGILAKRAERVEDLQGEILRFETEAKARQAELEQSVREAGARAKKTLDEARARAQAVGAEQLAARRAVADADKKKAIESARADVETARKALGEQTGDFARAMAEKILGRSLNA